MRWVNPFFLALLPLVVGIAWWIFRSRRIKATLRFSDAMMLRRLPRSWSERFARLPSVLLLLAAGLLVVAMARPQFGEVERRVTSRGIDIVLAMDVSGSMRAQDFQPDRLGAAREVVKTFVSERKGDQLALVTFATSAFTLCPATLDYGVVEEFVDRVEHGMIDGQSTAIGTGLATALKSLEESKAKSKIVILLTDGVNNAGTVSPLQAAEAAKALTVRVYTIGVGSHGTAQIPVRDPWTGRQVLRLMEVDLDEESLTKVAEMTGGKYYRATDNEALEKIYNEINQLEKSEREYIEHDNFDDWAEWLILPALGFLLVEMALGSTRFGGLP